MKFNELNEDQKARALETHRYINVDDSFWSDSITEHFISVLQEHGFEDIQARYSGFCSQGDGASFTAGNVDIEKFLRKTKRWTHYRLLQEFIKFNDISVKVVQNSNYHYVHSNTTQAEISGDWHIDFTAKQQALYDNLETEIDEFITAKGDEFYNTLYKEYYYQIEDEQVQETIIADDMDFEEDPREPSVTYL